MSTETKRGEFTPVRQDEPLQAIPVNITPVQAIPLRGIPIPPEITGTARRALEILNESPLALVEDEAVVEERRARREKYCLSTMVSSVLYGVSGVLFYAGATLADTDAKRIFCYTAGSVIAVGTTIFLCHCNRYYQT